jgi:hypothetical protein
MTQRCDRLRKVVVWLSLPWLAGCRNDPGDQKDSKMIVTKQYRTLFKGLTLGVSTLEEAKKRPDTVSGATKPGPNPLLQPDLWLGEATLHFEKHDKTLFSVQIYDLGFEDINRITVRGSWSQLEKLAGRKVSDSFYIDEQNGVVYWDDEFSGTVTKIVYVSSLRVRAE